MCGRYVLDDPKDIYDRFQIQQAMEDIELNPNYNTAPTHVMPVIKQNHDNTKIVEMMKWGLVPFWANDEKIGYKMINARAETLTERPSWKGLLKHKRCLIPATGFYEWKREGTTKTPYYFHRKDNEMFAFAGLYDIWTDKQTGTLLHSYTVITTNPNKVMEGVHDRMPVMLKKENETFWIDPHIEDQDALLAILTPYGEDEMEKYIVSSTVNSHRNNSPELVVKI